jgi:hypothetical protein
MLLNPEVQAIAQEEIDRICYNNQIPTFEEADSLPYVTAMVLEVLRWTAIVPSGEYLDFFPSAYYTFTQVYHIIWRLMMSTTGI